MQDITVVVAEDSVTARELLTSILGSAPGIVVVGEARDGAEAVEQVKKLRPDVLLMDIHMPRMDGLEATGRIMVEEPTRIVLVSAPDKNPDVAWTMNALKAGALAAFAKPKGPGSPDFEAQAESLVSTVRAMSSVQVVRRWNPPDGGRSESAQPPPIRRRSPIEVVAVGASTGGPPALFQILSMLPGDFPVPVLLVQHIAGGFVEGFARWLDDASALRVKVAEQGEPCEAGVCYVGSEASQLGVSATNRVLLSDEPPIDGFRPSASHLFESVAEAYGPAALGVILTGMGADGAAGLETLKEAGGTVLAQDEASSIVFGMPKAAIDMGLADMILSLDHIPDQLLALVTWCPPKHT